MPAKGQDMQTSIYLARLIGPVALVAALSMLINRAAFRAMAMEFMRSPAMIYLSGILTMTAGVAIVLAHNRWAIAWPVLLTIFGWLATIGGAVRIVLPHQTRMVGEKMLNKPLAMTIGGAVWAAIGLIFCFYGYIR